jgi:hypothetical protein
LFTLQVFVHSFHILILLLAIVSSSFLIPLLVILGVQEECASGHYITVALNAPALPFRHHSQCGG